MGRPGFELAGIMGYEAHIAGLGDRPLGARWQGPAIRWIKRRSAAEIAERRAAVVAAVREVAPVELVNGGGTGSLHTTAREAAVTEVTAGSGFYAPTLFDRYADFTLIPAAMFALPVVRRPSGGRGHAARRRLPRVGPGGPRPAARALPAAGACASTRARAPARCRRRSSARRRRRCGSATACTSATPRRASCASASTRLHLVSGGRVVDEVPTYRGEGRTEL